MNQYSEKYVDQLEVQIAEQLIEIELLKANQIKELTYEQITEVFNDCYPNNGDGDVVNLVDFAKAILKKASEK